jgi:HAD superfamily hydrolase (TIGR01450 family)
MPLSPLLKRYDHVLVDLDGCVYLGEQPIPGSPEALAELRQAGKSVMFLTNDSRRSPEEYVRKLWSLGCKAALEEVVTVGAAIQYVLAARERAGTAYVIGAPAIFRHVTAAGWRIVNDTDEDNSAELVVVAGHDDFHFAELRAATQAALAGAELISTGRDRTFPTAEGVWPGTGAIVAALEYASERPVRSVGKPDPPMFEAALDRLGPGATLMVGDRIDSDLKGAGTARLDGAIVLSGVTTRAEAEAAHDPAPVAVAADLRALVVAA